jgi:hypothetical protein
MKTQTIAALVAAALAVPASAMQGTAPAPAAQDARQPQTIRGTITFYDQTDYNGRDWDVEDATSRFHWDYHIRSIAIHPGDVWQICARPRFEGCVVLNRSVRDATLIGIPETANIGSVRPAPAAAAGAQ